MKEKRKQLILLVDDELAIREFFKFKLERASYDVITAENGKGFNWRELPGNILDVLEQPHGRGVLLMRSVGAELSWNEVGNEVSMTLRTPHVVG